MAKKRINTQESLQYLLQIILVIILLLLSVFNIDKLGSKKEKVLGAETVDTTTYWLNLLEKHPTYKQGWKEIGRIDKLLEIDPNYYK